MAEEKFRMVSAEVLLYRDRLRAGPGWAVRPGGEPRSGKANAERLGATVGMRRGQVALPRQAGRMPGSAALGLYRDCSSARAEESVFYWRWLFFLLSRFFVFPGKGVRTFARQFLITVDSKFERTEAVSSQRSCPLTATGPCFPLWLCFGNQLFQNSAV